MPGELSQPRQCCTVDAGCVAKSIVAAEESTIVEAGPDKLAVSAASTAAAMTAAMTAAQDCSSAAAAAAAVETVALRIADLLAED